MSASARTPDPKAESVVVNVLQRYDPSFQGQLEEMEGGASTRRFYRTQASGKSLVAMFVPEPSQEIQRSARQVQGIAPFLEVQALLKAHSVKVPEIYFHDDAASTLLVEDLGDETLAQALLKTPEQKTEFYQTAILELARAQSSLASLPPDSSVKKRAFDETLLRFEVDHFLDWALLEQGIQPSASDHEIFVKARDYLCHTIAGWPTGFVHRDYQSRNLMVRRENAGPDQLVWIDFQDAMLGPRVYDLVALLTDSYQQFSREFVEQRLAEYCGHLGSSGELVRVTLEFDLVTVQRKLKDAGRFVFLDRKNKNPRFLPFVEPTIDKARKALKRLGHVPELAALEEMLGRLLD